MNLRDMIIFAAGVGVGAAGMFFGVKKHFKNAADKDIEEMRQYVREKISECHGKTTAYKEQLDQYKLVSGGVAEEEEPTTEEHLASDEHPVDSDEDEYDEIRARYIQEERRNHPEPRVIEENDFSDYRHHDKETLLYYVEDMTLAYDDNKIVDDTRELVGDALDEFFTDDDQEDIYVRNVGLATDFYVKKIFDSYDNATR